MRHVVFSVWGALRFFYTADIEFIGDSAEMKCDAEEWEERGLEIGQKVTVNTPNIRDVELAVKAVGECEGGKVLIELVPVPPAPVREVNWAEANRYYTEPRYF